MPGREEAISQTRGSAAPPSLSIIIPALNEARRLPHTLKLIHEYLEQQTYTWDIHVVSNGSTDDTESTVADVARWLPNLHLVSLPQRGKGLATREGVLRSTGDVVFLCDADLSMPADTLARFLHSIDEFDIVAGSREAVGAQRFREPWHRHLMGRVFNFLVRLLAVRGIDDTQCGFKAFRRRAADDLFSHQTVTGLGFDVEILFLAQKYGYRVQELPIDWYFDPDTRVRPGIDTVTMVGELLMIRLRDIAGHYGAARSGHEGGRDGV